MENYKQFEIREGIVFLIEITEAILSPAADCNGHSQLYAILECISDLIGEMVISFPHNGVGIYLYGCEDTGTKFPRHSGINKVFSLNDLNSSNMKTLVGILHDHEDGFRTLDTRFAPAAAKRDNLHSVLETILRQFQSKPQYNRKKLFWLTNSDKPYVNSDMKDSLRTIISDFEDNAILINPYFLETVSGSTKVAFDDVLYENIFLNTNYLKHAQQRNSQRNGDASKWSQTLVIGEIRQAISRLKEVRRTQFSCQLILSDGNIGGRLGCSIKGYSLYQHETIKFRQLYTETDQLKVVHRDTKVVRTDNNLEVPHKEAGHGENEEGAGGSGHIIKGFPVKQDETSEKVVLLTKEVLDYMKGTSFDHCPKSHQVGSQEIGDDTDERPSVDYSQAPYLKLVCFRNISKFSPYMNVHPALFVAADMSDGINTAKQGGFSSSFRTFRSLYQSCVKLQRYALVFGCTSRSNSPNLYALYPTNMNPLLQSGKKVPDGFLLIKLPWMNKIRSLPDHMMLSDNFFCGQDEQAAPSELVSVFSKLVDQYKPWQSYNPQQLPNPVMSYFYEVIKSEVLQIDVKEEDRSVQSNDWTARELARLREQAQASVDTRELFKLANDVLNKIGNSDVLKRAAESGTSAKRQKSSLNESDIIALWKHNSWSNVTVAQLKEFIGRYDAIKSATRKADMIENISHFLESRQRS